MKQSQALQVMLSGVSVFLTGAPGSGKTYTLNKYISRAKQNKRRVAITASTGIAATHIGGTTIHSWAGVGIRDSITKKDHAWLKDNTRLVKRYNNLDTLIIDEVSMLHGKRLDMINQICKLLRESDEPFGGLQIILTGDLFQLPPIDREAAAIDFVHKSQAWAELNPTICYLEEQHRQVSDPLLDLLQAMRANDINQAHFDALGERLGLENTDSSVTRLYSHNQDVEHINAQHLGEISSDPKTYVMETYGTQAKIDQLTKSVLAPEVLELKVGAEVMFVANNFSDGFVNGSRGKVVRFNDGYPVVQLQNNGRLLTVQKHSWGLEEDGKEKARVTQLPLRLAWAITIHKSQGMSLDSAEIDLSRAFTPGMGYVALSRVRSFDGVFLKGINNTALTMHPEIHSFDDELRERSKVAVVNISDFVEAPKQQPEDANKNVEAASSIDEALLSVLKTWRYEEGKARGIPLYMVANNKTIDALASNKPSTYTQLAAVSGVGPKMIERYGDELLAIVAEHDTSTTGEVRKKDPVTAFLARRGVVLSEEDVSELKALLVE